MGLILSKILWWLLSPLTALPVLILLGGGMALSLQPSLQRKGARLCIIAATLSLVLLVLPVGDWLLLPLEGQGRAPFPQHVDGIILLGGAEQPQITQQRQQPSSILAASRHFVFADLAKKYPDAKLVFCGGGGLVDGQMPEADVARGIMQSLGVDIARVTFEKTSRTTYENAVNCLAMMAPQSGQKWLLVTSAWHMRRALGVFRKVGWNVEPAPADYLSSGLNWPNFETRSFVPMLKVTQALHEYVGLIVYRYKGYTDTLWPEL